MIGIELAALSFDFLPDRAFVVSELDREGLLSLAFETVCCSRDEARMN
jgi:hypothetical protein